MDADLARGLSRLLGTEDERSVEDVADALWIARLAGPSLPPQVGPTAGTELLPGPRSLDADPAQEDAGATLPLHPAAGPGAVGAGGGPAVGGAARGPAGAGERDSGGGRSAATVRVPGESALSQPLALARALRPLKRRVPSRGTPSLDEYGTARLASETSLLLPAWTPRTERQFAAELVVDTGPSMHVWRQLAVEWRELLERHGAFRMVRCWSLDTARPEPRLAVFHHGAARPAAAPRTVPPDRLVDPAGRSVVLLLTDGVGPLWHDPALTAALDTWARTAPVAVLQVLPPPLWHRTAVSPEPALAHAAPPGRPAPLVRPSAAPRRAAGPGRWVPVLHMSPDWLAPWARLVAGTSPGWTPVMAIRVDRAPAQPTDGVPVPERDAAPVPERDGPHPVPEPPALPAAEDPAALVERFRAEASPGAYELAGYLAAVPLVLPVMRLVQHAMLPDSGTAQLAEVLLSGLLLPSGEDQLPAPDPELTLYDYRPGVRDALLDTLTRRESLRVLDVVSRVSGKVAARFGGTLDFRALLPTDDPAAGPWQLPEGSRPFARVTAAVLAGLGGDYRAAARRLAGAAGSAAGTANDPAAPARTPVSERVPGRPPGDALHPDVRAALLEPLVQATTVSVHGTGEGHPLCGSGFFVAPGWVLTTARTAYQAEAKAKGRGVLIGDGDRMLAATVEWLDPSTYGAGPLAGSGLALISVLPAGDHPCVWLTERTPRQHASDTVGGYGWKSGEDGERVRWSVQSTLSYRGGRLMFDEPFRNVMPRSVSGGPVVDLERVEVVGVVLARALPGSEAELPVLTVEDLRRQLAEGTGSVAGLYQRVITSHDRYHGLAASLSGGKATWTGVQGAFADPSGLALAPAERARLLAVLANLRPPASRAVLRDTAQEAAPDVALPAEWPSTVYAWRDGLGLLYDDRVDSTDELKRVLRYAMLAATAERTPDGLAGRAAERELWSWAQKTAVEHRLDPRFRNELFLQYSARNGARAETWAEVPPPAPPPGRRVLLEISQDSEAPALYEFQVSVLLRNGSSHSVGLSDGGVPAALLPLVLRGPLSRAFDVADEADGRAPLHVTVPVELLGLPVESWQVEDEQAPLGTERPVLVRPLHAREGEPAEIAQRRRQRWRDLHQNHVSYHYFDERVLRGSRGSLFHAFQALPTTTVPVLFAASYVEAAALHGIGFPVVLWYRSFGASTLITDFPPDLGVRLRTADDLPYALTAARSTAAAASLAGTPRYQDVTLIYDDPSPRRPRRAPRGEPEES